MSYRINFVKYKGKNHPLHKHNYYEIITYLEGAGCFHTPTGNYPVKQGNIVVVPPGVLHGTISDNGLQSIYVGGEFKQIFNFTSPVTLTDNNKSEGLTLARMIYRNRYGNTDYIAALCNAYTHFILQNLKMEDHIGLAVGEIIRDITDGFHDCSLNLHFLLNKSGYAEDYIRAHFKRITGKTPTAFLTDVRMKHACYLIDIYKNMLSLSDIAEQCGYTDYVYFSRKFKQTMGISPQKYKNSLI